MKGVPLLLACVVIPEIFFSSTSRMGLAYGRRVPELRKCLSPWVHVSEERRDRKLEMCDADCRHHGAALDFMRCSWRTGCVCDYAQQYVREMESRTCIHFDFCEALLHQYSDMWRRINGSAPLRPTVTSTKGPEQYDYEPGCGVNERFVRKDAKECRVDCSSKLVLDMDLEACPTSIPGCICKKGFLRDESDGTCVILPKCRTKFRCPRGETVSIEGDSDCATDCTIPWDNINCTRKVGCICDKFHVRDIGTGMCTLYIECDKIGVQHQRSYSTA